MNRPHCEYPRDHCIHELFEAHVRCTPTRVAALFGSTSISYGELDYRAERLATVLRARGIGPDVLVALCVERSIDLLVGLLGILKAGGAYVPIDPAYPRERIAFVLADSAAPVILTQRRLIAVIDEAQKPRIVLIDEWSPANQAPERPHRPVGAHHLAYVLYTSGSTGKPKGVQISHRSVVNFLHSMRREPGLAPSDILLAVTTLSFDIAALELLLPLTTGATLILAPWEVAADGHALISEIEKHHVTVLQATPATWRLMINAGWQGSPQLKALCGGEALPESLARELLPRCAILWNMYGPTETTIWSTCCQVTDPSDIHIGRPIDNTEVYILDAELQPVPVGQTGELMIGGDGLARGYLNRSELTIDRFIAHPYRKGERLYRSGDLARARPDGNIDCLGRLDFQVKVRGFRIELGEIENALARNASVKECVVISREDTPGDRRLVAYIVARTPVSSSADLLREHLRQSLPDYMMPAAFVFIPSLPLTPNGKIDRQALPAPLAGPTQATVPACSPTEARLKRIFEHVLSTTVESTSDNFFDLGGHSLLAAGLMLAIEREFGHRLPLAHLFEAPTIRGLAIILDQPIGDERPWNCLVPIQHQPGKPTLFLIHGAGGNILLYRELAVALGGRVSIYGFQCQGLDGRAAPLTTVEEMAARYVRELRAFQPSGPYHLGGYCMGGSIVYEMARLLRKEGQVVGLVALLDTYNFRLAKERTRFSALRQKLHFHLENVTQIDAGNLSGYLGEKWRMVSETIAGKWPRCRLSLQPKKTPAADEPVRPGVSLQEINDQAALDFMPASFAGELTVFRARKQYDFMSDPQMGWSDLVTGQLRVVPLPVNPHAMLVQPYVGFLAEELIKRLPADQFAFPGEVACPAGPGQRS